MEVQARETPLSELQVDLHATTVFEGTDLSPALAGEPGAADAKPAFKKLAVAFPEGGGRLAILGLGKA